MNDSDGKRQQLGRKNYAMPKNEPTRIGLNHDQPPPARLRYHLLLAGHVRGGPCGYVGLRRICWAVLSGYAGAAGAGSEAAMLELLLRLLILWLRGKVEENA